MAINRKRINELPPSMAERAVTARNIAIKNPQSVDIDDEMLPWVFLGIVWSSKLQKLRHV